MMNKFKPSYFMLATSIKKFSPLKAAEIKKGDDYIYEEKYDGQRVAVIIKKGKVRSLLNRKGYEQISKFSHHTVNKFTYDAVFDAEIYVENNKGISRLNLINKKDKRSEAKLYVFDILSLNGKDLRAKEFAIRREYLEQLKLPQGIKLAKQYNDASKLWKKIEKENREGIVAKNINDFYIAGRSKSWVKIKNYKEKVIKFNKAECHDKGVTLESLDGKVRVSCMGEKHRRILDYMSLYGEVKAEIQYLRQAKSGKLYQPTFKRLATKEH